MLLPARLRSTVSAALIMISCAAVIRAQKPTSSTPTEPRIPKFIVKGRVVYDDTERPVRRSAISLIQLSDRSGELTSATDRDGRFVIENVPATDEFWPPTSDAMKEHSAGAMHIKVISGDNKEFTVTVP